MLSVSILNMYAEGFESLVKLPKLSFKKKTKEAEKQEPATSKTELHINYFAGPSSVFVPDAESPQPIF